MRSDDIKLGLVLVVALILAGIIAKNLSKQHSEMTKAQSLSHASRWPVAGFQKFLADVVWMRFLNFAGSHSLNDANVNRYEWYLKRIIALDPDFYEVYRDGALFFGPIDIERALWFVDAGLEHPRFSKEKSQLPLIGGQIIMRRESMKYYKGKEMDHKLLQRAQAYFAKAKAIPDHLPTAVTNFVRSTVFLSDDDEPRDILELREWAKTLTDARLESEGEDMDSSYGHSLSSGSLEQRVIRQIRKVAKRYIQGESEDTDATAREKAKEAVQKVIATSFPDRHFDAETFAPYPATSNMLYRGSIEEPTLKNYMVELDADTPYAIQSITVMAGKGTAEIAVLVNGKPVKGLDNITVGTKKVRMPKFTKMKLSRRAVIISNRKTVLVPDPLYNNKGRKGSKIEIQVKSANGVKDLSYILRAYKGSYF